MPGSFGSPLATCTNGAGAPVKMTVAGGDTIESIRLCNSEARRHFFGRLYANHFGFSSLAL